MPFFAHPDLFHINYYPYHLASRGVWNIYSFNKDLFQTLGYSYYPPLCYYAFGFYLFLIKSLLPGLNHLMEGYKSVLLSGGGHIAHLLMAGENDCIYRQIFMFKLPYLAGDIALAGLLLKLTRLPLRRRIASLWAFNPVILYATYLFGQFDILPAFFLVWALYSASKRHKYEALFSLGIAAALKNSPIVLMPLFILILGRKFSTRLKLLAMGLLPYLIVLFPLFFSNQGELLSMFYTPNIANKFCLKTNFLTFFKLGLMGAGYLAVLFRSTSFRPVRNEISSGETRDLYDNLLDGILLTLLLFYIFLFFNFQYFVWITPFILLKAGKDNFTLKTYTIMVLSLFFFKVVNKSMWAGLLAPLNPEFFMSLPGFDSIINRLVPFRLVRFSAHFVFAAAGIFLWIKLFIPPLSTTTVDPGRQKGAGFTRRRDITA
jgi:hypothetical protein